jgi:hypothetical protein
MRFCTDAVRIFHYLLSVFFTHWGAILGKENNESKFGIRRKTGHV